MSETHYNIQVAIQRVDEKDVKPSVRIGEGRAPKDKSVVSVLDLKVTAPDLAGAIRKVRRLLEVELESDALALADAVKQPDYPTPHRHRASCHGPIGELQCGFPA